MTKYAVTFIGDPKNPRSDPDVLPVRGVDFARGEAVLLDVATPAGSALLAKLKGNSHFKVEEASEPVASDDPAPVTPDPLDHDGDGKKGGSKSKGKGKKADAEVKADGDASA